MDCAALMVLKTPTLFSSKLQLILHGENFIHEGVLDFIK